MLHRSDSSSARACGPACVSTSTAVPLSSRAVPWCHRPCAGPPGCPRVDQTAAPGTGVLVAFFFLVYWSRSAEQFPECTRKHPATLFFPTSRRLSCARLLSARLRSADMATRSVALESAQHVAVTVETADAPGNVRAVKASSRSWRRLCPAVAFLPSRAGVGRRASTSSSPPLLAQNAPARAAPGEPVDVDSFTPSMGLTSAGARRWSSEASSPVHAGGPARAGDGPGPSPRQRGDLTPRRRAQRQPRCCRYTAATRRGRLGTVSRLRLGARCPLLCSNGARSSRRSARAG